MAYDQQGLTGDVESTALLGKCRRLFSNRDCLGPTVSKRCVGAKNRKIGIDYLNAVFKSLQQLRSFCVQAGAVRCPRCRNQESAGVATGQTVQGVDAAAVGISRSTRRRESVDSLDQHLLCRVRHGAGQGVGFGQIALGDI